MSLKNSIQYGTVNARPMQRPIRSGFTLIELLVVIAIISMLIAISFPSLSGARRSAKDTQCLSRIRQLYVANSNYHQDYGKFPPLNNDEDDGMWQYNYLIYDGRDFGHNFGPLINGYTLDDIRTLYCPVQEDPYHILSSPENPWPTRKLLDTRAGYGRRYHLSGKSLSQIKQTIAFAADLIHLPSLIKSGHKKGVNVVYTDGHARWVKDPGILMDNDLAHPFDLLSNTVIKKIWKTLDKAR